MNTLISFFQGLLRISLMASVMILIVLFIRTVVRDRVNIKIISLLWLLVILRLCLPGMVDSPVHIAPWFSHTENTIALPASPNTGAASQPGSAYANTIGNELLNPEIDGLPEYAPSAPAAEYEPRTVSFWQQAFTFLGFLDPWLAAAILWMAGGAIVLSSAIRERIAFGLYVGKNSTPVREPWMLDILAAHQAAVRIRRRIGLSVCPSIQMPMAYGVLRPHILLPLHMTEAMDRDHIRAILLHEVCHIKGHDILKGYACILAEAFHWFNPLVWLCVRNIKEDIEFSCDQRVLGLMDPAQGIRYCESLLHVTRFMSQRRIPQMAASLCERKSNLKERILRMITPRRKSKPTAAISLASALIMVVACFTTACQPTPENEIVQNKDKDTMEQKISQGQAEGTQTDPSGINIQRAQMMETDTWQDDTIESKPYLSITADARIMMPDVDQYMAYEINPSAKLSNDTLKSLILALTGDAELHDGDEMSRKEIDARLIQAKKELHDIKNDVGKDEFLSRDEEGRDYSDYKSTMIKRLEAEIETLNGLLETAVDDYQTTIDIDQVDFTAVEAFEAKAFTGRPDAADITVVESFFFSFNNPGHFTLGGSRSIDESEKTITLSANEAAAMGKEFLLDAGLPMYDIRSMGLGYRYIGDEGDSQANSPQGYVIEYERIVNGMPVCSTTRYSQEGFTDDYYVQYYQDEALQLAVDDAGIAQLNWENHYEVDEDSASVVAVMPMDERMKEIIIQQLYNYYSYQQDTDPDADDSSKVRLRIDTVELVMGRVPVKDNPNQQWLIPVWNVYATRLVDTGNGYVIPENSRGSSLVLSVNALDGTIN